MNYFTKRWLNQVNPEELSIFDTISNTNAESYHAKLKAKFHTSHPRVWNFMGILNQIIVDTDLDVSRLLNGKEISRQRKRKNILNDENAVRNLNINW